MKKSSYISYVNNLARRGFHVQLTVLGFGSFGLALTSHFLRDMPETNGVVLVDSILVYRLSVYLLLLVSPFAREKQAAEFFPSW